MVDINFAAPAGYIQARQQLQMQNVAQQQADIANQRQMLLSGIQGAANVYGAHQQQQLQAQTQDLSLKAMQGDPDALNQLTSVNPQAALQIQEQQRAMGEEQRAQGQAQIEQSKEQRAQREFEIKGEERERKELGKWGNVISVEVGENKRGAVEKFRDRVLDLGGDPANFGVDKPVEDMSVKELNQIGKNAQAMSIDPLKAQEMVVKREELALKKEDAKTKKLAALAEQNKLPERAPPIKDPDKGRADFTSLSKDFIKVRDAYSRIGASLEDPSAAGDMALIFNYMKMLDPGSTVREGEFATAQNAGGVGSRIMAQYNKVLRGERLDDTQRTDFSTRSEKLFGAAKKNHLSLEGQFTKLAEKSNIDPEGVVLDFLGEYRERAAEVTETPAEVSGLTDEQLMQMLGGQ